MLRKMTLSGLFVIVSLSAGCSGSRVSTRTVSDPVGESITYGAPRHVEYTAELDAGREYGRVTVFRHARCDVIPITVTQRYKETLEGNKVVERSPLSKGQSAGEPRGDVACDQTYAREVEVLLEVGGDRFSLGKTNASGQVAADLMALLKVGSFEELPDRATLKLRPRAAEPMVDAGEISLAQLKKMDARVADLVVQLLAILEKGETGASKEEIARSYEIYTQLQDIAPADPRVTGVSARFWELTVGRKKEEDRERLSKTLDALSEARETLKVMGDAAIPLYVQAAVSSGSLDSRALEWSSLRLIRALRGAPAVCTAGFSWAGVPSYGWPADARLAAQYTRYGYGNAYEATIQGACRTF